MATVRSIMMNIYSKFHDGGLRDWRKSLVETDSAIRRTNSSLLIATGRTRVLTTALLAMGPTAKVIGGVMLGSAAQSVAGFGAMGVAGITYGKVLQETAKRALDMATAGAELSESQRAYVDSTRDLVSTWDDFLAAHEDKTLLTATTYVEGLTSGIDKLNPIMEATHGIILRNAEAWKDWMERDDGAKRFSDEIVRHGVPALDLFEQAGRNALAALGIGFRDALKYSDGFAKGILRASESFRSWAEGGGFARFFEWVAQNSPAVDRFFEALKAALVNVGRAMGEIGPVMLKFATGVLEVIAKMDPDLIKAFYVALLGLKGVAIVSAIIGSLTGVLTFLTGPIGLVILAVAGLTATFIILWKNVEGFRNFFIRAWDAIKDAAKAASEYLPKVMAEFERQNDETGNNVHATWNMVFEAIRDDIVRPTLAVLGEEMKIWGEHFKDDWTTMWSGLKGELQGEAAVWKEDWDKTWDGFTDSLKSEGEIWLADINTIMPAISKEIGEELAIWKADWDGTWKGFTASMREEWGIQSADVKGSMSSIGQSIREEAAIWKADWDKLWDGFTSSMREEWGIQSSDVKSILPAIGQALREEEAIWEADWANMWKGFSTAMNEERDLMKVDVETMLSSIGQSFREETSLWKADWDGLWSGLTASMREEWAITQSDLKGLLPGIGNALREEGKVWKDDWDKLWDGFTSSMREEWDIQVADAKSILPDIGSALREEGLIWQTGWNSLWGGMTQKAKDSQDEQISDLGVTLPAIGSALSSAGIEWSIGWDTLWTGFTTRMSDAWNAQVSDLKGILPTIGSALREEGAIWSADWNNLWNGISTALKEEWEIIKQDTANGIKALGEFWDGLKNLVAGPVQWVIDVVWNNGLRAAWNWINDLWDGPDIAPYTVNFAKGGGVQGGVLGGGGGQQAFAAGGPVRGPGTGTSDSINARLSNNEHVWTAREVQAAGGHGAVAQLRSAILGGEPVRAIGARNFAAGGGFLSNFFTGARNAFSPLGAVGLDGFNLAAEKIRGTIDSAGGFATKMVQMAKVVPTKALEKVMEFVKNKLTPKMGVSMGWQQMWDIVRGAFPDATLTSSLRPGDPGHHGSGNAIDVAYGMNEFGKRKMLELNHWIADRYPNSTELIHTPGINLKNGQRTNYGYETAAQHWDHVHWAMAGGQAGQIGSADGWRTLVMQELAHFGQSASLTDLVLRRLNQESGGNARAINNWDINAQNGTPSKGLMQVIDPTFNAFKNTGMHPNDIWDPGANIHAAFNYAMSRYGSLENAFNRAGGYYGGTLGARSGYHWVGERGAELVKFRGGEQVFNQAQLGRLNPRGTQDTRPLIDTGGAPLIDARGATKEGAEYLEKNVLPKLLNIAKTGPGKRIGG